MGIFRYTTGVPRLSADQTVAMSLQNTSENPIEFAENDTRTGRLSRNNPIERTVFALRGDLVVTAAVVLQPGGMMNLIDQLQMSRDGNRPIFTLRGHHLQVIDRIYSGIKPLSKDPVLGTGTNPFLYLFAAYHDLGGYSSLLDASGDNSLDTKIDWKAVGDALVSGTATVNNVTVKPIPFVVVGALPGEIGGKGMGVMQHIVTWESKPVTKVETDFALELKPGRGYIGTTLFAYEDGVLSDNIINSLRLERENETHNRLDFDVIRGINMSEFDLPTFNEWTGIFSIPFARPNHLEHTLSVSSSQAMALFVNVNHPGTTDHIEMIHHYVRSQPVAA